MRQPATSDRTTTVIRVPRKYRHTIRAFSAWLKQHPDQAALWDCEEFLSIWFEQNEGRINSPEQTAETAKAYSRAMSHLNQRRKAS